MPLLVDAEAFKKVVSQASLEALHPNRMVDDDAVDFMLGPITRALGGRVFIGGGCYSTGPLCPHIQDTRALAVYTLMV